MGFLAVNTTAHTGNGNPSCLRDRLIAIFTTTQALALGHFAARTTNSVLDARVYLFLYGPIVGPTACHCLLLYSNIFPADDLLPAGNVSGYEIR
jgi:hypothetical protein